MKWTIQTLCMLCTARLTEADDDHQAANARLDAKATAEGWKQIGETWVCKTCGEAACRAFLPAIVEGAIDYTLRRVREDVDFFYVMHLTEVQHRLCAAYAWLTRKSLEDIEQAINTPLFPASRKGRVEELLDRVRELER